jgi:hypothetical protein
MSLTRAGRYARQPTSPVLGAKKVTENNSRENKSTNDVVTVGAWLCWQKKAAGNAAANKHTRQSLGTLTCFIMLSKLVSDENPGVPYDDFSFPRRGFQDLPVAPTWPVGQSQKNHTGPLATLKEREPSRLGDGRAMPNGPPSRLMKRFCSRVTAVRRSQPDPVSVPAAKDGAPTRCLAAAFPPETI